ncbi:MAG: metal-dependent transcriptional regulator [Erysipelotrichaceae bacterium]|nr:metal-dependent transcriptional regulator [Erysipelotrichaceae bacterium]
MKLFESGEDYLERILILKDKLGHVRSIDIVNDMHFSKPSISIAMKKLKENNYIIIDSEGFITLTKKGEKIAAKIYERHILLTKWLVSLGVEEEVARQDACKIEHDLSDETFAAIKKNFQ